jgi:hypothetical protein
MGADFLRVLEDPSSSGVNGEGTLWPRFARVSPDAALKSTARTSASGVSPRFLLCVAACSAVVLSRLICVPGETQDLLARASCVVELGAGLGLVSMCARHYGKSSVALLR